MIWKVIFLQIQKHLQNIKKRNLDLNLKNQKFINSIVGTKKIFTNLIGEYLTLVLNMNHLDMEYLKQLIGANYQYYMKGGVFHLTTNIRLVMQKHLSRPIKQYVKMIMKPVKQNLKNLKTG